MADVQIAVIDQQNTQIALAAPSETEVTVAVPGVQGPVGQGVPSGGTANQVLFKQSGTDYDTAWSSVTSAMIGDLEVVNADVSASAAIAGTKISPDFGAQNVTTTGTATAAALIPSGSSVPTNGVYLPSANNVAISTNGTGRLFVDASGNVGVGHTSPTAVLDVRRGDTDGKIAELHQSGGFGINILSSASVATIQAEYGQAITFETGTTATERLRITADGKVGVGTSSPSAPLHVAGRIRFGSNINYFGQIDHDAAATGSNIYNLVDSGGHIFQRNGFEQVRIDSSGRLLVGTSSDSGGALLQVNGNRIRVATAKTPASASDTGTTGEICWDASYIYVCTATNTWKRAALSTW